MADAKINYEHPVFDLKVETEGKLSRLSSHEALDILAVEYFLEELSDKKFDVFLFERDLPAHENVSFIELLKLVKKHAPGNGISSIKVLNADNIVSFSLGKVNILAKDVEPFKGVLKKEFTKKFNYAIAYEGYPDFMKFFSIAMAKGFTVVEDEEFPGTLLKFSKDGKIIQSVYIKDQKFEFLDSFSEKYKELQFENIREVLEKINENLKLEGKKPLNLEWDGDE